MSFLPGEKLNYAETHFKFRLPWSLLYKPWPEIIFDMAYQVIPGCAPTMWIVVRDADRFPSVIESIKISIRKHDSDSSETRTIDLNKKVEKSFEFLPVVLGDLQPGKYKIDVKAKVSRAVGDSGAVGDEASAAGRTSAQTAEFTRWNLPGLKPQPLTLHVLAEMPPKPEGFVAGETHCHTYFSSDHVEYGATPAVMQQAAKSVGLDFVSCTDHAYDFAFTDEDYTEEASSPVPRFQALRDEIAALPKPPQMPLMLAGEEVSAGNSKGENVHVTVLAPEGYLPGLGDCGRYWLDNKPTRKLEQILSDTKAHCFAAHPFQQMGLLEKFIFRRGYWTSKDLHLDKGHSIRGIQFWNGIRDEGFQLGREFWIEELGKGNYLLPIGGNDAHGDLNDNTAVHLPLISLKYSKAHTFGKVRTVVKLSKHNEGQALDLTAINKAFDGDNCYITDGPALWWERSDNDGRKILFHARNTSDFGGGFRYIRIYGRRRLSNGKLSNQEEVCMESMVGTRPTVDISVNADNFGYLRAECESATGYFAMTSAAKL